MMNTTLPPKVASVLHSLRVAPWFSRLGEPVKADFAIRQVNSWDEAVAATTHPVTDWCQVEGGMFLYKQLVTTCYTDFVKWNDIARANLPHVERLIREAVVPQVPDSNSAQAVADHIQGLVTGALMELSYSHLVDVNLFTRQLPLCLQGRFPCGWQVNNPDNFPGDTIVLVL